jgi:hypothetical protein
MFKALLAIILHLSENSILIRSAILSIVSIISSHIYYRVTYFKKVKSLQADLHELIN